MNRNEIHFWSAQIDGSDEEVAQLTQVLSTEEIDRAERYHFEKHKRRFIVSRGILRTLLSTYLQRPPHQIEFRYGPKGKPYLADPLAESAVQFNLSHSENLAAYVVSFDVEVGVDIEVIRPIRDALSIARRFFAPAEFAELQALPQSEQSEAFFACWTRKEAFIKATGDGLSRRLDQFAVSLKRGVKPQLVRLEENEGEASLWTIHDIRPFQDAIAAVAARTHYPLVIRSWNDFRA